MRQAVAHGSHCFSADQVSLDPIVVDEVFVAAVQQATAGKSRGTTKASLGANTAGSSSSIGRTRVNVFATTRRNESTSRGRSRPRRRNMPHLSDELQAEAKAKTQGASADFKKMTGALCQVPVSAFNIVFLQLLQSVRHADLRSLWAQKSANNCQFLSSAREFFKPWIMILRFCWFKERQDVASPRKCRNSFLSTASRRVRLQIVQ